MHDGDEPVPADTRRKLIELAVAALLAWIAAGYIVDWAMGQVPLPQEKPLPSSAQVYDRNGELVGTYRDEVARFIIDTDKLPEYVGQAVVAAEDRNFYEHQGLSLGGVVRAAWRNFTSGEVEQGGSTITQQYAKNALLEDSSRTIERKAKEAILAIKLEERYTKDEILDRYLNTVYFGRGAYGIEAAARAYFAKHAQKLTLTEAAYLAGIIPAPEAYQPDGSSDVATERRDEVLRDMQTVGYITDDEFARASSRRLRFTLARELRTKHQRAAYFMEWLRKEYLYPQFGDCLYTCGLKIHTTLDLDMQQQAQTAMSSVLDEPTDPQAALISMTPSGRVRAMIGGRSFTNVKTARGFNYATDGVRQAGSSFKPFTLLTAIEENISTHSYFSGESPKTIEDSACIGPDGVWEPENYGGASYGAMDLESATANSVNTVYAELITEVGPDKVAELLEDMGFRAPTKSGDIEPVCSLSLGTLDVSVLEMARAYAALAGRGAVPEVVPIDFVEDESGACVWGFGTPKKMKCDERVDIEPEQAVEANSVDVLTRSLQGVIEGGTGVNAGIGRPAAGKTGTTQDNKDAWFAGYVPQLATVVWMGYPVEKGPDHKYGTVDDFTPLMGYCYEASLCRPVDGIDVTGGTFPAAIWQLFMSAVLSDVEIESFLTPLDEPDIVIDPPPPPENKDKDKGHDGGDDDGKGQGNGHD